MDCLMDGPQVISVALPVGCSPDPLPPRRRPSVDAHGGGRGGPTSSCYLAGSYREGARAGVVAPAPGSTGEHLLSWALVNVNIVDACRLGCQ